MAEWFKAFVKPVKYNDKEAVEQLTDVQEQLLEYSYNIKPRFKASYPKGICSHRKSSIQWYQLITR